jgi:high-affinity iron transporter
VSGGVAAGLVGAVIVAFFAGAIADGLEGRGQELFNAAVLLAAVAMLAWHNIWMSQHGREIAGEMRRIGHDVSMGTRPLTALAVVVALAVLREGSETVLFLYGLVANGSGWDALLVGGALGLAAGAAVGWLLYRGLLAIPIEKFFTAVSWLILLLAAGLAAGAAAYLNQAGILPELSPQVWDTSGLLAQESWLGTLLHILIGYNDRPMGLQVVFYVATVALILLAMRPAQARAARTARTRASEAKR